MSIQEKNTRVEISQFIHQNMEDFKKDAIEYGGLDITIAVNDDFTSWNYQTGDNSYTGGAYGLPHWAVSTVMPDTDADDLCNEVFDQLDDLINQ